MFYSEDDYDDVGYDSGGYDSDGIGVYGYEGFSMGMGMVLFGGHRPRKRPKSKAKKQPSKHQEELEKEEVIPGEEAGATLDEQSRNCPLVVALLEALQGGKTAEAADSLRMLLPSKAMLADKSFDTLKKATSRLATVWERECDRRTREREERSEQQPPVLIMGMPILPEVFGRIISMLDRDTALMTSSVSKGWWRTTSQLPPWQHLVCPRRMKWSMLLYVLERIPRSNPWRKISAITLGGGMKVGNFKSLHSAAPALDFLDKTRAKGMTHATDWSELGSQFPGLKGLSTSLHTWGDSADLELHKCVTALPKLQALNFAYTSFRTRSESEKLTVVGISPVGLQTLTSGLSLTLRMLRLRGSAPGAAVYEKLKADWDKVLVEMGHGLPNLVHLELEAFSFQQPAWMSFIDARSGAAGGGGASASGGGGHSRSRRLKFIAVTPLTTGQGTAKTTHGYTPTDAELLRCSDKVSRRVSYCSSGWIEIARAIVES